MKYEGGFFLSESTLVDTIWFVGDAEADWMAMIYRQEGERWEAQYRFRYYVDDKAFDSQDTKAWTKIAPELDDEREKLRRSLDQIANQLGQSRRAKVHKLIVRGTGLDAADAMAKEPWSHRREIKP